MNSLRSRLFAGLSALVVATNVGFGVLAYRRASEEATELQDAVLRQVGQFAVRSAPLPAVGHPDDVEDEEQQFHVVVEEFGSASPGFLFEGVRPDVPDGLRTVGRGGRDWRMLVLTSQDGRRFGIGQPTASRDERVRDTLLQTLVPVLLMLPCLLVLVGVIIHASFRPLSVLSARLDARKTDDLRTLPAEGAPDELRPFIDAINRLLGRVGQTFEQRRRFVADAAHELRTPVTALTVQVGNLSSLALAPEGRKRLGALQGGIRRVAHLLEQLLSLARYDGAPPGGAPTSALDMAARDVVAGLVAAAAERRVDLGFGRIEPASVRGDPTSLGVMMRNLIENAVRHGQEGGQVDVEVFRAGSDTVFRVADDGPGIPLGERERLFSPFVRGGRAEGEGSGLGLSIVRSIAVACGGRVELGDRADGCQGLVATVLLPGAPDARVAPEPTMMAGSPAAMKRDPGAG